MPVEFQDFGSKIRRSAAKGLRCERVEQFCVRLIVEPVLAGARHFTSVKIVVWQIRMAGTYLSEQLPVTFQSRVEAGFEHAFRFRRRRPELQHF